MANTTENKDAKAIKMVKTRLPRLRKGQADETVGINGKMYKIKRGVEVEVPENVAQVLEQSERQREKAYAFIEDAANR